MTFSVIGTIDHVEIIAAGREIRDLARVERLHGRGRWRKLKGIAAVQIANGEVRLAELHWYEAHGIGRRMMKIKAFLDE